jgi:phosphoglycolate phosphatase-like HAD superfamily hydrolase
MFSGYFFDVEGKLVDSVPQYLRRLLAALEYTKPSPTEVRPADT